VKFSLESKVYFEAKTRDEALMKIALHFLALMDNRPSFIINNKPPVDALGTMIQTMPSLNEQTTSGYIDIDIHGDYAPPQMIH